MSNSFTTEEGAIETERGLHSLARFIASSRLFLILGIPTVIIAFVGPIAANIGMYAIAQYAECRGSATCEMSLPIVGSLPLTWVVLLLLCAGPEVLRFVGFAIWECGGQFGALSVFRKMINGLAQVRTTFFDEYPSGKIINRIVRDFDKLKFSGLIRVGDSFSSVAEAVVLIGIQAYAHPLAPFVGVPIMYLLFRLQATMGIVLRRASVLRSARFGEVVHRQTDIVDGAEVFRLYGHEGALLQRFADAVSRSFTMNYISGILEGWTFFLGVTLSNLFTFFSLIFLALALHSGSLSTAVAAVLLTALSRFHHCIQWVFWATTYLFDSAGDADRVFEFVDLPPEESEERRHPTIKTQATGPSLSGTLEFRGYTMSYRPTTPVILRDITLSIPFGQKVGIIGKTGSGKSSLVQSLFRMVFVHDGDIVFDGRSLFEMSPSASRALMSVVPQLPYLFEGTIRSNLDHGGHLPEESLLSACQKVGLQLPLDYTVSPGGTNLSVGERQLVCLARVIVSSPPIVLLDEPTSAIDMISDALIQRVLKEHLQGCTLLTIAHRLETLSSYDRIIQIEDGQVILDTPPQGVPLEELRQALG